MKELKQNTLAEATTESSFLTTINENAGETVVSLQREVELETGETVTVEGITPSKMKNILNHVARVNGATEDIITYKTPGEPSEGINSVVACANTGEEFYSAPSDEDVEEAPLYPVTITIDSSYFDIFSIPKSEVRIMFGYIEDETTDSPTRVLVPITDTLNFNITELDEQGKIKTDGDTEYIDFNISEKDFTPEDANLALRQKEMLVIFINGDYNKDYSTGDPSVLGEENVLGITRILSGILNYTTGLNMNNFM